MKILVTLSLLCLITTGCGSQTTTKAKVDNSATNERDQNSVAKTPLDQHENQKDISTIGEASLVTK